MLQDKIAGMDVGVSGGDAIFLGPSFYLLHVTYYMSGGDGIFLAQLLHVHLPRVLMPCCCVERT